MEGFRFSTDVSVRFAETDAQGIAHHAVYLVWLEVARIAYLARFGDGYKGIQAEGIEAVTTETYVRYRSVARFDDRVTIHARAVDVRGARFRFEYALEVDGALVAEAWTGHACAAAGTLRPTRVPGWLVAAIRDAETG